MKPPRIVQQRLEHNRCLLNRNLPRLQPAQRQQRIDHFVHRGHNVQTIRQGLPIVTLRPVPRQTDLDDRLHSRQRRAEFMGHVGIKLLFPRERFLQPA